MPENPEVPVLTDRPHSRTYLILCMFNDFVTTKHRGKNGSNQSFDLIKDFKSSVKSLCAGLP